MMTCWHLFFENKRLHGLGKPGSSLKTPLMTAASKLSNGLGIRAHNKHPVVPKNTTTRTSIPPGVQDEQLFLLLPC